MKALILSGGTGTRLRPLTYTMAKQLVPVANKPILFYIVEKIAKAGIKKIGIVTGDTCEQIKQEVGNGEKWNVKIEYIRQSHPLGLAHAVKTAERFLAGEDFLMVLGDNLFEMGFGEIISSFYKSGSNAAILLHESKDPSQFGVAVVENERVKKLVEKPCEYISSLIITGVYVFDKTIFQSIDNIEPSDRGELEITDAMQNLLSQGKSISYCLTKGWWKDTGKVSDILEANRLIMDSKDTVYEILSSTNSVHEGKLAAGKNVKIENSIIKGPVIIDDYCTVINSVLGPYTCLGKNVRLSKSTVRNSIVMQKTEVENIDGEITNSLIGRNVVIRGKVPPRYQTELLLSDNSKIKI